MERTFSQMKGPEAVPSIQEEFLIHQGDVLIMAVPAVPTSVKLVETVGVVILAHGETTGHSHRLIAAEVAMFRDDGAGGETYLSLPAPGLLEHGTIGSPETADHAALHVCAGAHEVCRQVEWSDEIRPLPIVISD